MDWAFEEIKRIALKFPTRTLVAKTTADLELQKAAEESDRILILQLHGKAYGVTQAAMVAM